jgi:membrane protease YdiL (CAAX protease family)
MSQELEQHEPVNQEPEQPESRKGRYGLWFAILFPIGFNVLLLIPFVFLIKFDAINLDFAFPVVYLLSIAVPASLLARSYPVSVKKMLGIERFQIGTLVGVIAMMFGATYLLSIITHLSQPFYESVFGASNYSEEYREIIKFWFEHPGGFLFILVFMSLGPGIFEEIYFRGVLFSLSLKRLSTNASFFLVCGLFALCHGSLLHGPYYFFISVLLCWTIYRARVLTYTIIVHALINGFSVYFVYFFPDLSDSLEWWEPLVAVPLFIAGLYVFLKTTKKIPFPEKSELFDPPDEAAA